MDPTNRMVIYTGYAELWKNPQQGSAPWINLTNGAVGLETPIDDFTIAPSNSNFIYVIKEPNAYKTIDGGKTWIHLTNPLLKTIQRIVVHPQNPDVLWASNR